MSSNISSSLQKTGLPWGGDTKPVTGAGGPGGGVGGGGAGGGTQGLAHWMSVMAEHMNHETAPLHPAYMWHNGIDQKMSLAEQQQLLQKGESPAHDQSAQRSVLYMYSIFSSQLISANKSLLYEHTSAPINQ